MPGVHEPIVVGASTTNNDVIQFTLLFPVLFTNPSDQDHLENIVENSKDTGVTPGIWNITVLLLASIVNVTGTKLAS